MKSIEALDQQLGLLNGCDTETQRERAKTLCDLSYAYALVDVAKSLDCGFRALGAARELHDRHIESLALRYIGVAYGVKGMPDKADENYIQSMNIAREIGYDKGVARCLNNLAINYHNSGKHKEALDYYRQSLAISKQIDDKACVAVCNMNIGELYFGWGDNEKALQYQLHCLEIAEAIERLDIIIDPLANIGNIYAAQNNPEKAMDFYVRALAIAKKIGLKERASQTSSKIGHMHSLAKRYKEALASFNLALDLSTQTGHKEGIAYSHYDIGLVELELGHIDKAEQNLLMALQIAREINYKDRIASCLRSLGKVKIQQQHWDDARRYLDESLAVTEAAQLRRESMHTCLALSKLFEKTERYKEALDAYRKYALLKDNIFNEEKSKAIAEMQTKYETVQKEKEAELLRQKNEELENSYYILQDTQNELIRLEKRNSALALAVTAHHELNQPLMVMKGNLDMFHLETPEDKLTVKQIHYLNRIEQSFTRMTQILNKFKTSTHLTFDNYAKNTPMIVFEDMAEFDDEETVQNTPPEK
ncbi:MAG: tetratricopeptide repeat protein [Candidatus Cloacimonetes bacterium]|nr:tetratricopeptide repeat protein [Candidatus Cloacimonadota bacterium]